MTFHFTIQGSRDAVAGQGKYDACGDVKPVGVACLCGAAMNPTPAPMHDVLHPAGIQAEHILQLWHGTLWLCTVVFVLVLGACLLALWRGRRATGHEAPDLSALAASASASERGLMRVVAWSTVLAASGLVVLLWGDIRAGRALAQLPAQGALRIELVGHNWWWEAHYEDTLAARRFVTANELHLPVGRAAIITLRSDDVIHSLWVPNLHGKLDLIPGRATEIRVRADRAGAYRGQCAEFCGLQHTMMALLVVAEAPAVYERWAAGQHQGATPAGVGDVASARGAAVFSEQKCASCHAIRGTSAEGRVGPDLTHLASRQTIAAGMLPNRRGHLAGWIVDAPSIKPGVQMPRNALAPDDLQALLAYLEGLQ